MIADPYRLFCIAYMLLCDSITRVTEELNLGIVVISTPIDAGFDACYSLNQRFVMSSPLTLMALVRAHQPWLKGFWYYPLFTPPTRSVEDGHILDLRLTYVHSLHLLT